jgi:DNA-binding transcriptional MerR regulator
VSHSLPHRQLRYIDRKIKAYLSCEWVDRLRVASKNQRYSRRRFSQDDLLGIALVLWLFEAGLRTQAIQHVLNQICGGRRGSRASDAARILIERKAELLTIKRSPRKEIGAEYPKQRVVLTGAARLNEEINRLSRESLLVIPLGNLYSRLKANMNEIST